MSERIFADAWRECLRAHYQHVIRTDDQITLRTLVGVLHEVGFTDAELRQLEIEATMRADDMPNDYVPDMTAPHPVVPAEPEPDPDLVEPAAHEVDEADEIDERDDASDADDTPPDPNAPQQLSLF